MTNLTQASHELYRRSPDECFASLDALTRHCQEQKRYSVDRWHLPQCLETRPGDQELQLAIGDDGRFSLNDWSFTQLCRLGGVSKDTVNRLSPDTASRVFCETIPASQKPLQLLTSETTVRSIHGITYSRLWNTQLLELLRDYAGDYCPPPVGFNGATGLYCGEQDLFCFLIDPAGWIDISGEMFAPGFFVWNSEVGKRSLGISTFWFQKICQNHIVWDSLDVREFSRKHTGNIGNSLDDIRRLIDAQKSKRAIRQDGFVSVIQKAMQETVGTDADSVTKFLQSQGLQRDVIRRAVTKLGDEGRAFTIWSLVDAITHLNCDIRFAGDRMEADQLVAKLLALAV